MTAPNRLGKYDLVARIGKGGMAEIYLARQRGAPSFSRLVVIKRILPHLAEEPHFVRMFLEEARLAALIAHPNVVQIYDVDQDEGHFYIAMEYINGPSLGFVMRKLRRAGGAMPYEAAAEVIAQACDGLHAAHELVDDNGNPLEVVHRDISPHNLMVTEAGLVKLLDFGIAKAHGSAVQTRTGSVKGKYPYMSPEQCRGEQLDRRADIFSLGIVFLELLTGRRVFQRQTDLMTLKAITEEPVPHARDLRPEVPEDLSRIIDRCLQRRREERYATAAEIGRAVRSAISALGESSGPALLQSYLASEHGELLISRAEALRQASAMEPVVGPVPVVDGLGDSHGSSTASAAPAAPTSSLPPRPPRRRVLLWTVLGAGLVTAGAGGGLVYRLFGPGRRLSGPPLKLAMPPSFPAEVAEREIQPLLRYLERRLRRPFQLVVPRDYKGLREGVAGGAFDLANLPPLQFVLARHNYPRVKPLLSSLHEGARTYQAMMITRDDSGIEGVASLRGRRFCYVDPESTSGYLLPRLFVRKQGFDPDKLFARVRFSGNHLQVVRDVLAGHCDGGAIFSGVQLGATQQGVPTSRMRILGITGHLPYDILTATPELPDSLCQQVRQALLELDALRDLGSAVLGPTFRISGFTEPHLQDFVEVERAARAEGLIR